MANNGKFFDMGIITPNQNRNNPKAPSHKGVVDLSPQTLQALNEAYKNGEPLKLQLSCWRKNDNPNALSVKLEAAGAYQQGQGGGGRQGGQAQGNYRRSGQGYDGNRQGRDSGYDNARGGRNYDNRGNYQGPDHDQEFGGGGFSGDFDDPFPGDGPRGGGRYGGEGSL